MDDVRSEDSVRASSRLEEEVMAGLVPASAVVAMAASLPFMAAHSLAVEDPEREE
jgi:hypothetical protein